MYAILIELTPSDDKLYKACMLAAVWLTFFIVPGFSSIPEIISLESIQNSNSITHFGMKLITTTTVLGCLAISATASLIDTAKEPAQGALNKFTPLTPAVQIPCCVPPCPYCPLALGNNTASLMSISYPSVEPLNFKGSSPGCGEGYNAEDCLRFFQVTLTGLDSPLKIAASKAGSIGDEQGKVGCGEESSAGECLRYLKSFFEEVMKPLETTLGQGSLVDASEVAPETTEGKSEL
jgi:hypothetical protein